MFYRTSGQTCPRCLWVEQVHHVLWWVACCTWLVDVAMLASVLPHWLWTLWNATILWRAHGPFCLSYRLAVVRLQPSFSEHKVACWNTLQLWDIICDSVDGSFDVHVHMIVLVNLLAVHPVMVHVICWLWWQFTPKKIKSRMFYVEND